MDVDMDILARSPSPIRPDEKHRAEQRSYLPSVAELARSGTIALYSSTELLMERMRQRQPGPGYMGLNLFEGLRFNNAASPIDRTIVFRAFGNSEGATKEEQNEFLSGIADKRFLELRRLIGDAHLADTFHIWTAEHAGLDGFLTMERRLTSHVRQLRPRLGLTVDVLTPKNLCAKFDKEPIDIETFAKELPPFR